MRYRREDPSPTAALLFDSELEMQYAVWDNAAHWVGRIFRIEGQWRVLGFGKNFNRRHRAAMFLLNRKNSEMGCNATEKRRMIAVIEALVEPKVPDETIDWARKVLREISPESRAVLPKEPAHG